MDSFWETVARANVDLNCLFKVRSHLDKIEKEQEKIKREKLSSLFRYLGFCAPPSPPQWVPPSFSIQVRIFLYYDSTSQTYRDVTNLQEILTREEKNNDLVDGAENFDRRCSDLEKWYLERG